MSWQWEDTLFMVVMVFIVCLLGVILYLGYTKEVSFCNYLDSTTSYNVSVDDLECHIEIEDGIWVNPYDKTELK